MAIDSLGRFQRFGVPSLPRGSVLRGAIVGILDIVLNVGLFVAIALGVGTYSSWLLVERGSALTTRNSGPWTLWVNAGRPDVDPYTQAHFARIGSLPLSTTAVYTWQASVDDDGQRLHSSCEYALAGEALAGDWWSLSVFDEKGRLIPNSSARYTYSSGTVAIGPDNNFIVTLARDARPGNWLPTGGAGRLVLVMSRPAPRANATPSEVAAAASGLPAIRRIACR